MGGRGRPIKVEREETRVLSRMCLHRMKFQGQKLVVNAGGFSFVFYRIDSCFSGQHLSEHFSCTNLTLIF